MVRAGLGRREWTLLICYPDNVDRNPTGLMELAVTLN